MRASHVLLLCGNKHRQEPCINHASTQKLTQFMHRQELSLLWTLPKALCLKAPLDNYYITNVCKSDVASTAGVSSVYYKEQVSRSQQHTQCKGHESSSDCDIPDEELRQES